MLLFSLSAVGFVWYFYQFHGIEATVFYLAVMAPVLGYFLYWRQKVWKNESKADFSHTMWLNMVSSLCLNSFFVGLYFF